MRGPFLIIVSLFAFTACQDELSRNTERAADRVKNAADHLRHERGELSVEVAERADDIAEHPTSAQNRAAKHAFDIANEVGDVSRRAAELATAQQDFQYLRSLRVQSLRAEHSVAASQPLLIQVIANVKAPLPTARRRLDENLVIYRQRLAETRNAIEQLQFVPASEWESRDDEVAQMMAGMFIARDASWHALEGKPDTKFPAT